MSIFLPDIYNTRDLFSHVQVKLVAVSVCLPGELAGGLCRFAFGLLAG